MYKKFIIAAVISMSVVAGAQAGSGGNGSGNPRNSWDKQPVGEPHYVWKDGKLVSAKEKADDKKVVKNDKQKGEVASK